METFRSHPDILILVSTACCLRYVDGPQDVEQRMAELLLAEEASKAVEENKKSKKNKKKKKTAR